MKLCALVYALTKELPKDEQYGLVSQMRRSAVSIPCNIAEGNRRGTRKDYRSFILIALGSGAELETQLELLKVLALAEAARVAPIEKELSEIMKMLNSLSQKLLPIT